MKRKSEATRSRMIDQKQKYRTKGYVTSLQIGRSKYALPKQEESIITNIDEWMRQFIKVNISESRMINQNSSIETIKAKQLSNKIIKYVKNQQACIREELYKNISSLKTELEIKISKITELAQIIIKNYPQIIKESNSQNLHLFVLVLKQIHICMMLMGKNYQDLILLPRFKKQIFSLWNQCLFNIFSEFYQWILQYDDEEFYSMCFYNCLLIGKMAVQSNNYAHTYQLIIKQYPVNEILQLLQLVINKIPSMSTLKSRQKQRSSSQMSQQKALILDFFIQCIELQTISYCIRRDKIKDAQYLFQGSGQDLQAIMKLCHIYVNFLPGSMFSLYLINLLQIVSNEVEILMYLDDLIWSTAKSKDVLLLSSDQFHFLTIILCKYSIRIPKKQCNLQNNIRKWLSILWRNIVTNPHTNIKLLESAKTYMSESSSQKMLQILFQQYKVDNKLDSTYHSIYDNKYIKNIISYLLSLDNSQEYIYTTIENIKQFIGILFNALIFPRDTYEQQSYDVISGSRSELLLRYLSSLYLFINDQLSRTNFSKKTAKLTYRKYLSISLLEQFHQQLNKLSKNNSILELYNTSLLQISNNINSIECQNARDGLLGCAIKLAIISRKQALSMQQQNKQNMQQQNENAKSNIKINYKTAIFSHLLTQKIQNLHIIQQCCQYLIQYCIEINRIQVEDQQMQALLQFIYYSISAYPYQPNQKLDKYYGYTLAAYIFITVYTMANPVLKSTISPIIDNSQIRYLNEIIQSVTYPQQIIYKNDNNILSFLIYIIDNQGILNKDLTYPSTQEHINKLLQISEVGYNKLLLAVSFYYKEQNITNTTKTQTNKRMNVRRENIKKQKYDTNVLILCTEIQYMSIEIEMIMTVMFCYYTLQIMVHIVQNIRNTKRQGDKNIYGRLITMIYVIKKALSDSKISNHKTNNKHIKHFLHSNIMVRILNQLNQVILSNIQSKILCHKVFSIISLNQSNYFEKIKNLQEICLIFTQSQYAIHQYALQYGINMKQAEQNNKRINQSNTGRIYKSIKVQNISK